MPRRARVVLPGYLHHITQRGNYKQNIFHKNQDRAVYLKYIDESSKKYGMDIYAFCLMSNHVHFIVKPLRHDSLARTFRVAHHKYSTYINKRLKENGHLWQSRFYSCVVLGGHILRAVRYVERNPVRAKMVSKPWDYAWSSARSHLGISYKIITLSNIREYINVRSWKRYLMDDDALDDLKSIRKNTQQGKMFGPSELIKKVTETFYPKRSPSLF